jgi:hypothetical protein
MASREDVHRLVDAVPEACLPVLERLLCSGLAEDAAVAGPRQFFCAGTLSDEHDLAERSGEILRDGIDSPDRNPPP